MSAADTARAELERALGQIGAADFDFELNAGDGHGDGYHWSLDNDALTIDGDSPRGLLFGVYAFLESLGFLWPCPGTEIAPLNYVVVEPSSGRGEPALPGRCLIIGSTAFLPRIDTWIEWCARNRLNTVFFHLGSPGVEMTGAVDPVPAVGSRQRAGALDRGALRPDRRTRRTLAAQLPVP